MENFGILFVGIFWPTAIILWFKVWRRRFRKPVQVIGSVLVIGLPLIGGLAMADEMFIQEPLITAAADGNVSEIERCLSSGADVNAETNEGGSALSFAVFNGNVDAVRVLLKHHANPNVRDEFDHKMLLAIAEEKGDKEIARLLRQPGATEGNPSGNEN